MLKGISPLLSPQLLETLARMGHGDTIVLADAHFPGDTYNPKVIRADGIQIPDLLNALLPLIEIDTFVPDPVKMMAPVEGDTSDPAIEEQYLACFREHCSSIPLISKLPRYEFYNETKNAFAVLMTGETAKYGNIILTKGVIA
ncbi:MAG: L-fucose mutarotase [Bacteroidota bacterium]